MQICRAKSPTTALGVSDYLLICFSFPFKIARLTQSYEKLAGKNHVLLTHCSISNKIENNELISRPSSAQESRDVRNIRQTWG